FTLVEQAVEISGVTVVSERNSVMSSARTGAGMSVSREQLEAIPTISRNFSDALKMSPLFAGYNAGGRNSKFNDIKIDGAVFNDLFGLSGTGQPGGGVGTSISLDALQEFQVVIAPFDVRQGGFTGGGINAITRSGTNKFTGSAYYYGQNQDFRGTSPDTLKLKLANYTDYTAGFRVGGPVIENKLFFFVNGEMRKRTDPIARVFGAPSNATNQFALKVDSLNRFISFLKGKYGYDPGSYTDITKENPLSKIFARLDYNLSQEHRLSLRHNYGSGASDSDPSSGAIFPANELYKTNNTTNSTVLQLTSAFGNTMANELIFGYTTIRDKRAIYGAVFPEIWIKNAGLGGGIDLRAGAETYSNANALDQDVIEFTDNFTYFMGNHTFTLGTQNYSFKFSNLYIRNLYGNYEFTSLDNFNAGKPSRFQLSYSLLPGVDQPRATFTGLQLGFYAQDEWKILPTLKVNIGLRLDIPTFPDKPLYNPSIDTLFGARGLETNKVPSGFLLFSPRVGFNYDPTGDRTWQIRGGAGIFTGRISYVWLSNQYGNTGMDLARFDVSAIPAGFTFQPDPYQQSGSRLSLLTPITTTEVDLTNPDFKMPQVFRVNLGVDRELPLGFVGTVEGLFTQTVNDIMYQDISLSGPQSSTLTPGGTLVGDGRYVYGTWSTTSNRWTTKRVSPKFTNVIYMTNTSDGYSYNITAQVQRTQVTDGWYANLAYTYGMSKDRNSIGSSQALSQWRYNQVYKDANNPDLAYSTYDLRHHLIGIVSYRFEAVPLFGTTLSLAYEGRSGGPITYYINGDLNGDGQTSNDLAYIPKDANDVILVSSTGAVLLKTDAAYTNLNTYINNSDYLSSHRGQVAERNGGRMPWSHYLDLGLTQEIPTLPGHRFEIRVDVLNILNLLNHDWGYNPYLANYQDDLLTFHSLDPVTGQPRFRWTKPSATANPWVNDNLSSRWGAQIGLRYSF
ncbi:MAG: hypothetical protein NTZ35_20095, partial [Ignavibacteriales bacterium]|nr:hypothetical protein [Ignavibacteriales bacterium]